MDNPILNQITMSYCPIIDRDRNVMATRLIISPVRPGAHLPVDQLVKAVASVWPEDGPQVSLSVRSESLLADLLQVKLSSNLWIEVPKFMAGEEEHMGSIQTLAANGNTLLLSGRPERLLPREVLPAFKFAIIDLADERRLHEKQAPAGIKRSIGFFQEGIHTMAEADGAFSRGAMAVLGWPMEEPEAPKAGRVSPAASRPDLQVTLELINKVDDEAPLPELEATLKRDPTLAYKLMRYINSPIFGLRSEVTSFSHAVMMLGYSRLKRWLALLLVTAGNDVNLRPVMFAAVRRGLLMEALAVDSGNESLRSEMFICGVFSLLDRLFRQPFADLLKTIPVPEPVHQALVDDSGPLQCLLDLVRVLEGGTGPDIRDAADRALLDMRTVNRTLFKALSNAAQLA